MSAQEDKARAFAALHQRGDPLVLMNIWDAGSARAVERAGAKALATGSHSLAGALGCEDGEQTPLADVIWQVERICRATQLPVSHDLERGYGKTPQTMARSCAAVILAGAIGLNIEDSLASGELRDARQQTERLKAARAAVDEICAGVWINARTDVFLVMSEASAETKIDAALGRANAYAEAGANSLFVPFTEDLDVLARLCDASPLPVNAMRKIDGPPISAYAEAGIARISHGPFPWIKAMNDLSEDAACVLAG